MKKNLFNLFTAILIAVVFLVSCAKKPETPPFNPVVPANPSPGNGETVDINNLYLNWSESFNLSDENEYRIYYSQNENDLNDYSVIHSNQFQLSNLKEGVWYWKVEAVYKQGLIVSSPVWNFIIDGQVLPQPSYNTEQVIDPAFFVDKIDDTSFTLKWNEYTDVQNPENSISYTVNLYRKNNAASEMSFNSSSRNEIDYTITTTDTSHLFENMEMETKYRFTIIAKNKSGNTAEIGSSDVKTGNRPPSYFKIISPLNHESDIATDTMLQWEESIDPDGDKVKYFVYLGTSTNTCKMISPVKGLETESFSPLNISEGQTYHFTVVAKDENGAATKTNQNVFNTAICSAINPFPSDNASNVRLENYLTLTWESKNANAKYDVYFGNRQDSLEKIASEIIEKQYTIEKKLLIDEIYYWKIVSKKDGLSLSGPIWSFKTEYLSSCTDFIIKAGFDYLSLLTDAATEIQYDAANVGYTTTASVTDALVSTDGSVQTYSVHGSNGLLNPDNVLPAEATLTVTSAAGNKKEFRIFKEITYDFILINENDEISYHKTMQEAVNALQDGGEGIIYIETDLIFENGIVINNKTVTINPTSTLNQIEFRGDTTDRCFSISNNASVTLNNLSISNFTGAVYTSNSYLNINSCTITNNEAYDGAGISLNNCSTSTITDTLIASNTADWAGGGIRLYNSYVLINNSDFTYNTANYGGAICLDYSSANIADSMIASNTAHEDGGGICTGGNTILDLENTTILYNSANNWGGGIGMSSDTVLCKNDGSTLSNEEYDFWIDNDGNISYTATNTYSGYVSTNTAADGSQLYIW